MQEKNIQGLYKLSQMIAVNITLVVVLISALALLVPSSFEWISTKSITPMLGVVMFGMGLTLKPSDFEPVLMRPKDIIVSHNAEHILSCSLIVGVAVILHNILGLALGYAASKLIGLPHDKSTAISIEVGMQNSGLATSLAATHFAMYPMAAVPGAIFSTWHNFSGSIAASIFRRKNEN